MVRRLHHRQLFLFQEPAHGHLQERSRWYVVAVEYRHELAFGIFQRIVDVARFRMFMSGTGDIFHPHVLRKLAKLFPAAVIEDPDVQFVFRPVDTQRGVNGIFHHVEIFVVSRDKDIHRRPQRHIFRQWHRLTIQRPYYLEVAEHQHNPRVRFSEEQNKPAHQADRIVPVQRRGVTPPDITARNGQRQHNQHQRREAPRHPPYDQRYPPQQHQEDKLRQRVKRLSNAD